MSTQALRQAVMPEASASTELTPLRKIGFLLDNKRGQIATVLPKTINIDHFIGVCKTALMMDARLAEADTSSIFLAAMKAAQDGLMPDGKQAVFNVYNTKVKGKGNEPDRWVKKAQYLPMVAGILKKIWDSGQVTYMDAAAVFDKDKFSYIRGDESKIVHEPDLSADPGQLRCAYFIIKLANGETKREVMPRRDIDKVRAASKAADDGPWVTWFDQMAIKSVIKRGAKQLQLTPEIERVIQHDNEATVGAPAFDDTLSHIQAALPNDPSPDASTIVAQPQAQQQVSPAEEAKAVSEPVAQEAATKPSEPIAAEKQQERADFVEQMEAAEKARKK